MLYCTKCVGVAKRCVSYWSAPMLGRLSKQYSQSLSRENQTRSRTRKMRFSSVARVAHWDGDQTHGQQAPQRSHSPDDAGELRTSIEATWTFKRRNDAQYVFYRALEWHDA